MRGYQRFLVLMTAALFLCVTGATADTRGLTLKIKASEALGAADAGEVQLYKSSHALVIGIDAYTGGWPPISSLVVVAALPIQGAEPVVKFQAWQTNDAASG